MRVADISGSVPSGAYSSISGSLRISFDDRLSASLREKYSSFWRNDDTGELIEMLEALYEEFLMLF